MLRHFYRSGFEQLLEGPVLRSTAARALERLFQVSATACMPGIFVPNMGDSISEGTVAAILKKQGDGVKVDEVIAQIETDKVTIDIKSTEDGVLQDLLIKEGTIVNPGQLVASVTKGGVPQFQSSMAEPTVGFPAFPAAGSAAAPSTASRAPSISFPPRRTPTGERISDFSPQKQAELMKQVAPPSSRPAPAAPPAASAAPPSAPAPKATPTTTTLAPKPAKKVLLKEAPPRRGLTAREIEFINSGGA